MRDPCIRSQSHSAFYNCLPEELRWIWWWCFYCCAALDFCPLLVYSIPQCKIWIILTSHEPCPSVSIVFIYYTYPKFGLVYDSRSENPLKNYHHCTSNVSTSTNPDDLKLKWISIDFREMFTMRKQLSKHNTVYHLRKCQTPPLYFTPLAASLPLRPEVCISIVQRWMAAKRAWNS